MARIPSLSFRFFLTSLLFCLLNESLCVDPKVLLMPHLMGAKLVGIFEDEHKPNLVVPPHPTVSPSMSQQTINQTKYRKRVNAKKLHFCDEVIFKEGGGVQFVPTMKPSCILGHDHDDHHLRLKREGNTGKLTSLPNFFRIPATKPLSEKNEIETILADSYIKMKMRVCSEPGGEVLVFDAVTNTILSGFKNLGATRQCNKWMEKIQTNPRHEELAFEKFISESNKIQVEYKLPYGDDYIFDDETHIFISEKTREGHRFISYKRPVGNSMSEADSLEIFTLELKYEEVKFTYEEEDPKSTVVGAPLLLPPVIETDPEVKPEVHTLLYKPNWVKTYILGKRSMCDLNVDNCQEKFYIGITVTISHLDLDFDRGDYLLIGPGMKPDFWKNSHSHLMAQPIGLNKDNPLQKEQKIWINADSAYLRVVTHNSLFEDVNRKALQFSWLPANDTLPDMKLDPVSQLLKEASIQLCVLVYKCNVFENLEADFANEAVRIFNRYLIDNEKSITTLIDRESVRIFDHETFSYAKGHQNEQYCQFNLAIASPYDSEYPLVKQNVLRTMLFGDSGTSRKMVRNGVTITNCEFERISWVTILVPIAVILLISLSVMLVFWRMQNRMQNNKSYMKNRESPASIERLHKPEHMSRQFDDAMQY